PAKSGSQGDRGTLFEGTTFPRSFPLRSVAQKREQIGSPEIIPRFLRGRRSSFLPAETGAAGSNDIGLTGDRRSFFAGTTFPHSVGFTDARWPLSLSSSSVSSSSPSLQGGSGIPAVPKTGASVLRLLAPTSGYGPREGSQGNRPHRRDAASGA